MDRLMFRLLRRTRLYGVWCLMRGYPVAYRIRVENGGLVFDGRVPSMCMECTVIGAATGFSVQPGKE